jgi:hypothetical protein
MRDGAVWSSCDDALLGMGLLKWGQSHAAIAADLLPGHTPSQVAQRVLERTHRNRAANPVKVWAMHPANLAAALLMSSSTMTCMIGSMVLSGDARRMI